MRRFILFLLIAALVALVLARAALSAASAVPVGAADYGRNELDLAFPLATETAGSALIAQMSRYYLSREATGRSALTGALGGKSLILICADGWRLEDGALDAETRRLMEGGVRFSDVYRPDWYQGMDGREFALLSGLVPTNVGGVSALAWAERQGIYLPYALARALAAEGCDCRAYPCQEGREGAYEALGFSHVQATASESARGALEATLDDCLSTGPFFAYYVWPDGDGSDALAYLLERLGEGDLAGQTAVCLLTAAGDDERRARLFLWGGGLDGVETDRPCSELDLTPTLLNLFGAEFDARLLSGGDILAPEDDASVVSLYGSAYSDWVTERGGFSAAEGVFRGEADEDYVRRTCLFVYERYLFARRLMENNYFQLLID